VIVFVDDRRDQSARKSAIRWSGFWAIQTDPIQPVLKTGWPKSALDFGAPIADVPRGSPMNSIPDDSIADDSIPSVTARVVVLYVRTSPAVGIVEFQPIRPNSLISLIVCRTNSRARQSVSPGLARQPPIESERSPRETGHRPQRATDVNEPKNSSGDGLALLGRGLDVLDSEL